MNSAFDEIAREKPIKKRPKITAKPHLAKRGFFVELLFKFY